MVRYNKRTDPVGDEGLTRSQQAVARRWGEILQQLPALARAVAKQDFEALADKGERLAQRVENLWRDARAADRAPVPEYGAVIRALAPEALASPVGQALHPDAAPHS